MESMLKMPRSSKSIMAYHYIALSCGLALMLFLLLLMTLSELGFFVGLSPTPVTFTLAAILSSAITLLLLRNHSREAIIGLLASTVLVVSACVACSTIYDLSYDGNAHHKQAVALLHNGWNPVRESSDDGPRTGIWGESFSIWIDHYAQGTWCIGACFYAVSGDIEVAKCYTLIAMASAASIIGGLLANRGFRWWQAGTVAVIAAVNPITVAQAFSFYIDGFLMLCLLILLAGLMEIVIFVDDILLKRIGFVVVGSAFILCSETKFTGFAYAGVFSFAFYVLIATKALRGSLARAFLAKTSIFFAVVIISSILVFGFSPYVTNTLDHGHPFYPLFGEGAIDIMTSQTPASFSSSSHLRSLFLGFFSEASQAMGGDAGTEPVLKLPLTVHQEELDVLKSYDLRISGFGVLYSAILLIGVPVTILFLALNRKTQPLLFQASLCYLIPMCMLMLIIGESWWARYSSYSYFINPLALTLMFSYRPKIMPKWKQCAKAALEAIFTVLLVTNTALFIKYNTIHAYIETQEAKNTIANLEQAARDGKRVQIFTGRISGAAYSLSDRNIPFELIRTSNEIPHPERFDGFLNGVAYRIIEE